MESFNLPKKKCLFKCFITKFNSAEEKKKRERDEEEKRLNNELAFKSWLRLKEEQRAQDLKKKSEKSSNNTTANSAKKGNSQENSVSLAGFINESSIWLKKIVYKCFFYNCLTYSAQAPKKQSLHLTRGSSGNKSK